MKANKITLNEFFQKLDADMKLCKGDGCELKSNCCRYTITTTRNNPYFENSPIENGSCKYFF
jgi:hypothetical protein